MLNIRRWTTHFVPELPLYARLILLVNVAIGVLLPLFFALPQRGVPAGLVVFLFLLSLLIYLGYRADARARHFRLTFLLPFAFIVRSGVAILTSFAPLTSPLYTLDAESYDQLGLVVANAWASGAAPDPNLFTSLNVKAYAWLCGAVYYLLGHSLLTLKILNCFAGALVIYNVFRSARAFMAERPALLAALLLALFPSLIFWSSQNLRDACVFYGISEMIYASIRWADTGRRRWLLRMALALALTGLLRDSVAAVAAVALAVVYLSRVRDRLPPLLRPALYLALALALGFGLYLFKDTELFSQNLSPSRLSVRRALLAADGATNFPMVQYESWPDLVMKIPYVTAYYLLAPFPWHLANTVQALASAENLLFVILLGLAGVGAVRLWRGQRDRLAFLLLFVAGMAVVAGLVEGNIGTGYRHKMHIIPSVVILACAGINKPSAFSDQLSVRTDLKS